MKTDNVVLERIYNGIVKENPTFVMILGMCPTLAVTTSCINGFGMGGKVQDIGSGRIGNARQVEQ